MGKTHNHRRFRWSDQELDNYYRAAIVERVPQSELIRRSGMGRTWKAITTKLYKEFEVITRKDKDSGEVYFYERDTEVPQIHRNRERAKGMKELLSGVKPLVLSEQEQLRRRLHLAVDLSFGIKPTNPWI